MVAPFFVAASSLLLFAGSVHAQAPSAPNCTDPSFGWASNSLQQNPCEVVAYLEATCNGGLFSIPALSPGLSYTGPSGPDNGDICKCNSVAYNLISACDACQGSNWTSYSLWHFNCTTTSPAGTFPLPIPDGIRVPKWAFLDPATSGDSWNQAAAILAGDLPEVTGTAAFSSSTSAPQSTGSNAPSPSTSPASDSSGHKSHAGAIAGGVVGGLIAAALIAGAAAWFIIRRRRAQSAPSAAFASAGGPQMGQSFSPFSPSSETPRYYDPSDPSTFPQAAPSPTIHTTNPSAQFHGSFSDLQPNRQQYSGLPEV
ncbi:hypothetical protein BC834DRAFT_308983 [Gloeopeniophorella convolvens]|nr:hypothetical protein BC834DRAFT_308983 [Gloeopeniophorella convolvens]